MTIPFKLTLLAATLVLAGCATTKPPEQVALDVPAQFRETANLDGAWKQAAPADRADRGRWWLVFNDGELNALVERAAQSSPTLAAAVARVKEARAVAGVVDSDRAFRLDGGAGPTRVKDSGAAPVTEWRALVSASYEVDLIGRLSDASRAAKLDADAQEAAYRSVLLALQADVAQQYFIIRALDSELAILNKTIGLRQEEVRLVQYRYEVGDTSELDVVKARTELAIVQAEAESVARARAQQDHALAVLLGQAPAQFSLAAAPLHQAPVIVPAGLPSELLERRPDIAQAQRQLAAASARIGVAKAAFLPKLVLTGSAGYASSDLGDLFKWSSRSWLLGPLVGTALSLPIFDGGRNKANLARADANYEAQVANYRQTVLVGFREVEDNLSALGTLDRQLGFQDTAVASAQKAAHLAEVRYRNGSASYFEVIDAQRTLLAAERAQNQSLGQRSVASVGLIRALGGDWETVPAGETIASALK
jgi:multidrug efflux system outer membrane protein